MSAIRTSFENGSTFAAADLRSIRIGDDLRVFDAESTKKVHATAKRALARGVAVTWEDGRTQWIHRIPVERVGATGSDRFDWNQSGDKVRADRVLYTKSASGEITIETVAQIWISL